MPASALHVCQAAILFYEVNQACYVRWYGSAEHCLGLCIQPRIVFKCSLSFSVSGEKHLCQDHRAKNAEALSVLVVFGFEEKKEEQRRVGAEALDLGLAKVFAVVEPALDGFLTEFCIVEQPRSATVLLPQQPYQRPDRAEAGIGFPHQVAVEEAALGGIFILEMEGARQRASDARRNPATQVYFFVWLLEIEKACPIDQPSTRNWH